MATAPLRSMAPFSTITTRSFFGFAQYAASYAAPQPAIPPPRIRTSASTVSTCGSTITTPQGRSDSDQSGQLRHAQELLTAAQARRLELRQIGLGEAGEWVDRG